MCKEVDTVLSSSSESHPLPGPAKPPPKIIGNNKYIQFQVYNEQSSTDINSPKQNKVNSETKRNEEENSESSSSGSFEKVKPKKEQSDYESDNDTSYGDRSYDDDDYDSY